MIFLSAEELLVVVEQAIGGAVDVRDRGLLEAAAARPQSSWLGVDTYVTLEDKAAAFVQSLVSNHALVDGNKRLGLAGLLIFLDVNDYELTWSNDDAYEFIVDIAGGTLTEVEDIARRLRASLVPIA